MCGDNVDYDNRCHAQCHGSINITDGSCTDNQSSLAECISECPSKGRKVCNDGVEYTNNCQARCHGVEDWTSGPCDTATSTSTSSSSSTTSSAGDDDYYGTASASSKAEESDELLVIAFIIIGVVVMLTTCLLLIRFLKKRKSANMHHTATATKVKMADLQNHQTLRHNKNMPLSPNFVSNTDKMFNMKLKAKARADADGKVSVKVTEMVKRNPTYGRDIPNSQWHEGMSSSTSKSSDILINEKGEFANLTWDEEKEQPIATPRPDVSEL